MSITCSTCDFETTRKSHFKEHVLSIKHIKKCEASLICCHCLKEFKRKSGLVTHSKTCKMQIRKDNLLELIPSSQPITIVNNTVNINVTFQIDDLINDEFTTSLHRMVLLQLKREPCDLFDYAELIDNDIQLKVDEHNQIQIQDIEDGFIKREKPYALTKHGYNHFAMTRLCMSTTNLVITHRDFDLNENNRQMLFKHDGKLHTDAIIDNLINASKFKDIIIDDGRPLPAVPTQYQALLVILYNQATRRRDEHNRNNFLKRARS